MIAREQLAGADAHPGDARFRTVACVADDIAIAALDLEHDRRLFHSLQVLQDVSQFARSLEVERVRGDLNPLLDAPHDLVRPTIQKEDHLVDHRPILGLGLQKHARGLAATNVVVETGPFGRDTR